MNRFLFILLFVLGVFHSSGQEYAFKATHPAVQQTMYKAVANSKDFIVHVVSRSIYNVHFSLLPSLSTVRSDYAAYHYTPVMDDTISFIPGKYELRYLIKIGNDTLTDSFVIPVDSLGNVDIDTTDFHYILDDLKAYKKLLTGQYKFDYEDVKLFIKKKKLSNSSIILANSVSTMNSKNYKTLKVFKHFWYITEYRKGGHITLYTIDPDSGKMTIQHEKIRVVP